MIKIILFVFVFSVIILPQQFTNWRNYVDMKHINSASASENIIWAATNGGAFLYNITTDSYTTLSKADGLSGVSLTAAAIDQYNKVWFGSNNGIIDIFNPADNSFRNILDINNNTTLTSKRINEISASGDTILVSTDFGISLIDVNNYLFFDTFSKFGDLPSSIPVNSTLKANLIYACTNQGIAVQKPGAVNLSAPESWNVYKTADGLPSNITQKVVSYKDSIIVATSNGLALFNGTGWSSFIPQLNSNINDLLVSGDSLYILSNSSVVHIYFNGSLSDLYSSSSMNLVGLSYTANTGILISTLNGIILVSNNSTILPNGPAANLFPGLVVDKNSVLWSASGTDVTGVGFYRFDGEEWQNFNRANTPELPANSYYLVYAAPDNTIYFGSWGRAFIGVKDDVITYYSKEVTGMEGVIQNPDFIVIGGFSTDSRGNLWVLNYGAVDRRILTKMTPDEQWEHFIVPSTSPGYYSQFFNLVIDQFDTKWFCSQLAPRQGLYYFNERNTPDLSDDVSGFIDESNGLSNSFITSIVVDRRGDLWIGTSLGVNIISNTSAVLTPGQQLRPGSVFSLRQQSVTAIAVDPLNQKWIGTNQGLILVNPDGTSLLATFDTRNSALLSNQITSIAIDENTGTVYVGTDLGLTSFKTTSVKPAENFDELFVFPNPFIVKGSNSSVTIEGLIRDTNIKILSVNGKLVKQFSTPGGRIAFWDGRDESGNLVASGVYFIVAFDKEGNNVAKTKVAVLRDK